MKKQELKELLKFDGVSDQLAELMLDYEMNQVKKRCKITTIKEENKSINRFFNWYMTKNRIKMMKVSNIRSMKGLVAQQYVDWLSSPGHDGAPNGYKNASLRKYVANIGSFMKYLVKYGHIDTNPISGNVDYPFEQKHKVYYSQEEGKAVIDAIQNSDRGTPKQNKAIAMLIFYEGLRINEVSTFKIKNYLEYKDQGLIKVLGKGRGDSKQRIVTLFKDVEKAIDDYLESGERRGNSEYLFTTDRYKASGDFRSVAYIRRLINDAREETGFNEIIPHCFRKLLVERLMDAGVELEMASKILGHSDISTTRKFYLQMKENSKMQDIREIF